VHSAILVPLRTHLGHTRQVPEEACTTITVSYRAKPYRKELVERNAYTSTEIRNFFMRINTLLSLAASVVIGDCVLVDTRVYAASVESIQPTLAAISTKTVSNQSHRKKKIDNDHIKEKFEPRLPDESAAPQSRKVKVPLEGSAKFIDVGTRFCENVRRFTKFALEQDPEYKKTARAADHYSTKTQRAIRFTKDAINYAYPYRGFSMSIEGSRVITDKRQKLDNLFIAELCKQRYWDEEYPKIMAKIMQIAMGLGMGKSEQADIEVQKGVTGLTDLVGEESALSTLAELTEWNDQLNIPETVFEQPPRDVDTTERIYANVLKTSADGDPLISEVFKRVKKFDHGKLFNSAAGVVEANLSAVTVLSGNPAISVAAEGANTAFVMSTGGPEENKILQELYYGRRLEIRRKRISDETELALMNYEKALLTHNRPLLAMSEIILAALVGPERIPTVLERDPVNDFISTAPIELGKMPSANERAALEPNNSNTAPIEKIVPEVSGAKSQEPSPTSPTITQADLGSDSPNIASIEKIVPEVSGAESQEPSPTSPTITRADLGSDSPDIASIEKIAPEVRGAEPQIPPTSPIIKRTDVGPDKPDIVPIKTNASTVSGAESKKPSPPQALPQHHVHVRYNGDKQTFRHAHSTYVVPKVQMQTGLSQQLGSMMGSFYLSMFQGPKKHESGGITNGPHSRSNRTSLRHRH